MIDLVTTPVSELGNERVADPFDEGDESSEQSKVAVTNTDGMGRERYSLTFV